MKMEKISFLKRMYLAITDFRLYPYAKNEKLIISIGYFLKLNILMSVIIGAFFTSFIFENLPDVVALIETEMPEFTISNGKLNTAENIEKEVSDSCYLVVQKDTKYKNVDTIEFKEEEEHNFYVLVLSDATTIGMRTTDGVYEVTGILYEPEMNLNKIELLEELNSFQNTSGSKIYVWLITVIGISVVFLIFHLWAALMYAISIWIINFMFGIRLKWKDYTKIAIYVSTLPIILETTAIVVVGKISETVNFITIIVSCVYIFYALRALKIDSFIGAGTGKTTEERIKDALEKAQKELEKQIEELEKQEKQKNKIDEAEEKNQKENQEEKDNSKEEK